MRQLPAVPRTAAPRTRPAPRCQTSAPRNAIRQTIATDLRLARRAPHCRATDPPAPRCQTFAPRNGSRQTIATGPPPRLRTPAPPRLQRNPPNHRYAPARRASNPPSITPLVTDHPRKPPNPRQRLIPSRNAKRANCILPYSWPFQSRASGGYKIFCCYSQL